MFEITEASVFVKALRRDRQRHKGTKAQRHKGTKAQRHKGTKAQRHKGTKASVFVKALRRDRQRHGVADFKFQNTRFKTNFDGKSKKILKDSIVCYREKCAFTVCWNAGNADRLFGFSYA